MRKGSRRSKGIFTVECKPVGEDAVRLVKTPKRQTPRRKKVHLELGHGGFRERSAVCAICKRSLLIYLLGPDFPQEPDAADTLVKETTPGQILDLVLNLEYV